MIKIPLGFSRIWLYGFGVAGGVNDDDALALFELGDDVVGLMSVDARLMSVGRDSGRLTRE